MRLIHVRGGLGDEVGAALNKAVTLAEAAKLFGVPTVLTAIGFDLSGPLDPAIRAVLPEVTPIERSWINA